MNREILEFLFNLRASGFVHHTPEKQMELFSRSLMDFKSIAKFPEVSKQIGGEVGSLSNQPLTDLRNMFIGINFIMFTSAYRYNIDMEYALGMCDYYCNKAETITSFAGFELLYTEVIASLNELFFHRDRISYGHPMDDCIHFIDQNLYSSLQISTISGTVGYTPQHLNILFKKHLGMTVGQYIRMRKIDEAKVMIQNTRQSLTSIAISLGFSSLPHFSAEFKKTVGVSPLTYRSRPY